MCPPPNPIRATFRLDARGRVPYAAGMTKVFSLLIILAMAVQFIKPLGLPGLKKRSDAWKLAIAALAAIILVAATKGA